MAIAIAIIMAMAATTMYIIRSVVVARFEGPADGVAEVVEAAATVRCVSA